MTLVTTRNLTIAGALAIAISAIAFADARKSADMGNPDTGKPQQIILKAFDYGGHITEGECISIKEKNAIKSDEYMITPVPGNAKCATAKWVQGTYTAVKTGTQTYTIEDVKFKEAGVHPPNETHEVEMIVFTRAMNDDPDGIPTSIKINPLNHTGDGGGSHPGHGYYK